MPKIVDREQQRALILDRSFAVFVHRGYGHLRMRALAQDIGVSFGTLYHYFPSKEALFYALLERYFQRAFPALPRPVDGGLRATLLRVVQQLEAQEPEVSGLLALTLDYVQAHATPFTALDGRTLDDLLEAQITASLGLSLPHTRLFRQQVIGVLMLRRLTPSDQPLSTVLKPFIDLIAPL
ncbi:TetR/AcrR family transcriptional regulator [Deinococcus marmoris]|uniref:Transcriptional regulator, TetR family n=1 Tax=Deinococcus marmoris TaxID=249408 RepID=A0A1U7NTB4_9DEIO|nr:TetR/AcrR family transcriptional regulator [Deinococcus marmoris]OLV16151.1 Transcriptional regulator, TetR family [Deinococcus marmoris]